MSSTPKSSAASRLTGLLALLAILLACLSMPIFGKDVKPGRGLLQAESATIHIFSGLILIG